jgi:hypothetical protein
MQFYLAFNSSPWSDKYQEPWLSEARLGDFQTAEAMANLIFAGQIEAPKNVWLVDTEANTLTDKTEEIAELVRNLFYENGFDSAGFLDQWLYKNNAQFVHEEDRHENVGRSF